MTNTKFLFESLDLIEKDLKESLRFRQRTTKKNDFTLVHEEASSIGGIFSDLENLTHARITTTSCKSLNTTNKRIVLSSGTIPVEDIHSQFDLLIKRFFSEAWISTNAKIIDAKKKNFHKAIIQFINGGDLSVENESPVERFEEIRNNYRIIMMCDPVNKKIKIGYTNRNDELIINPFIAVSESNISSYQYARLYVKWDLWYLHIPLFKRNLQQNNPQFLILNFGFEDNGRNALKRLIRCATIQKRLARKLQRLTFKSMGADSMGVKDFDYVKLYVKETEETFIFNVKPVENTEMLEFAQGAVHYFEPDFSLIYYAIQSNGAGFSLIVKYLPYYSEYEHSKIEWTAHYVTDEYK